MKRCLLVLLSFQIVFFANRDVSQGEPYNILKIRDGGWNIRDLTTNASGWVAWSENWEIYLYDGLNTTQITDNDVQDFEPKMNDSGYVVWERGIVTASEILLYDGTDITQITDDDYWDDKPRINASGQVVWQQCDELWPNSYMCKFGHLEIFLYDGVGVTQITDDDYNDRNASISDNGQVVWEGYDVASEHDEIYLYDGTSTTQITHNDYNDNGPQINAIGQVAWVGSDGGFDEVFLYDGSIEKLTGNSTWNDYPRLNDYGLVVWSGYSYGDREIYLYDGESKIRLTDDDYYDDDPQINNSGLVVWRKCDGESQDGTCSDGDWEVFLYDGSSIIQITDNDYQDSRPLISDSGQLVWCGKDSTGDPDCSKVFVAIRCSESDDYDEDGHVSQTCGGDDCDDLRAQVHPGAAESCENGIDDDCDGLTDYEDTDCPCLDNDGDGYGVYDNPDCPYAGLDCDDEDPSQNPGAAESCENGIDDDCDGLTDYEDTDCPCLDNDGDGYGVYDNPDCPYAVLDCDDSDSDQNPGAVESCENGIDDDCDGLTDYEDADCPSGPGTVVLRDGEFDDDDWDQTIISTGCFIGCGAAQATDGGNPGEYRTTACYINECSLHGEDTAIVFHGYGRTYSPMTGPISSIDYAADVKSDTEPVTTSYNAPALRQGGIIFTASGHPFYSPIWESVSSTNLTETSFSDEYGAHPDFSIFGGPIQFGYVTAAPADGYWGPPNYAEGVDNWEVILYTSSASYFATANAHAASYGAHSLIGSGVLNELSLLLVPVGAVIWLRVRRRKR